MRRTTITLEAGVISAYYDWFENAENGDILVYHVGDLAFDRDKLNASTHSGITAAKHLDALASRVLSDAEDGFLTLTQSKIAVSTYEYRAVRKNRMALTSSPKGKADAEPALA